MAGPNGELKPRPSIRLEQAGHLGSAMEEPGCVEAPKDTEKMQIDRDAKQTARSTLSFTRIGAVPGLGLAARLTVVVLVRCCIFAVWCRSRRLNTNT